ncbi:MAG: hypothetical protein JW828_00590, partial [Sedimentisphaerales bacterium]|nr:hypothetical protein [Sedimentisphaerales bacterium]
KFRSGPLVRLWPGWIIQLAHISFTWRTHDSLSYIAIFSFFRSRIVGGNISRFGLNISGFPAFLRILPI